MSFQPIIPIGGYAGWKFLQRTQDNQATAFRESVTIKRDAQYFRDNIAKAKTAEDLVSDRRLLRVALGAYGLDEDINNRAFIQRILEDGALKPDALGQKLSDKRYLELAKGFGFGDFSVANTQLSDFPDKVLARFEQAQFEIAIGEQSPDMRLAMSLDRELGEIAGKDMSDDARWFYVMGNAPLRRLFETALGLPGSFGALDLDQQLTGFREKAERALGMSEIADMDTPEIKEKLTRMFFARSDNSVASETVRGSAALALLQSAPTLF